MILAPLVVATSASSQFKAVFILLAFAGSIGDMARYWLMRHLSPALALLRCISWIGMWVGYDCPVVVLLRNMWLRDKKRQT